MSQFNAGGRSAALLDFVDSIAGEAELIAPASRSIRRLNLVLLGFGGSGFTGTVRVVYRHRSGIEALLTSCEVVGSFSVAYLPETRILVMAGDTVGVEFTGVPPADSSAAIQMEIL